MIHVFPISYRGMQLSVLTYRHTDGTREILSIGGWELDEVPPMMLSKAKAHIKQMEEYTSPQKPTSSWN